MVDWLFVSGNEDRLIKFTFGVGNRGDPPPLPTADQVQKELDEINQTLSTFRFIE